MQQQGQSRLDDVSWMDGITGGEFFLSEETMVPSMLMPDAPVTGLGIEPAVQAFETDTNNITLHGIESRELMQAVTERGSCSKMPVDKSVPSSSNNEGNNAASTALRGLEMEQEEQPLSDERVRKGFLIVGETELVEEPRAPVVLMPDEPETRQGTESFVVRGSSSKRPFLKLHQKPEVVLSIRGDEISRLYHLETLECNFRDPDDFIVFQSGRRFSQIEYKVTVGRPSFSSLEDLNYTRSNSWLINEAWFYDLKLDNANRLIPRFITKVVFVSCQNMRSLCPSHVFEGLEILHLDGLIILETLFEVPSKLGFCNLREMVIHKCHRMKVLLPPWLLSALRLEVIVVEECYNMQEIMGSDEHSSTFRRFDKLRVLVLKKLPNLNSIYSGRLKCDSLEEITVGDCPQLTRIPVTISRSLKKIEVDPESLFNTELSMFRGWN
uniref:Disease resistance protein At4g27190-like leucine-rich repeats domain-containing protein n=1 Tax=Populus alba TaxID=43335 RepID=A0A4U5QD83_POPAL|nr:hypothetical protein D5086_0000104060 [Populus alba]